MDWDQQAGSSGLSWVHLSDEGQLPSQVAWVMVSAGSAKLCHAPAGEPRLVHMGAYMGFQKTGLKHARPLEA